MQGTDNMQLGELMIHGIGNAGKNEPLLLTDKPVILNDVLVQQMLIRWFTASFDPESMSHFVHSSDLQMNELYRYATAIFEQPESLAVQSRHIATHLYRHSTHAKIREGELYIGLLAGLPLGDRTVRAIGIFKNEKKDSFLRVFPHGSQYALSGEEGINIQKVDKGVLILETEHADGFRLLITDVQNKGQETRYFTEAFLQAAPLADSYHHTRTEMILFKQFVEKSYPQQFEVGKAEQIDLIQRSMDYFAEKESFTIQSFQEEVIPFEEVRASFQQYRTEHGASRELPVQDDFEIHPGAFARQKKQFKSVVKLDKNFHIYIHGRTDLIEKGTDPQSGRQYYKLYFDEES